jgi:hypothetical protein
VADQTDFVDHHLSWAETSQQRLNISFCLNSDSDDWTLQINEDVHRHISCDVLEALVEGNLIRLISQRQAH